MKDMDPTGPAANVLRKMATGKKVTNGDLDPLFLSMKGRERLIKRALRELEARGYVGSKDMEPCQDYRSHHVEWSLTLKGMEVATVLEVMET